MELNYIINSSSGRGGSISPSGETVLQEGSDQTYTITPSTGYYTEDVKVDGESVGAVGSYTFRNIGTDHTIAATFTTDNIALNKPATAQSYYSSAVIASRGNDSDGTNNSHWGGTPYPQWWKVDLGDLYDITRVVLRNYYDGVRYYHYVIESSLDDRVYTSIAVKDNTNRATDSGDSYDVSTTARYLRVTMTYNSANTGVHISDFRVYGSLQSSKGGDPFYSPDVKVDLLSDNPLTEHRLSVFPNPFNDHISVRVDSPEDETYELSVIDLGGRTVYRNPRIPVNADNLFELNLPEGIYILRVRNDLNIMTSRIIRY